MIFDSSGNLYGTTTSGGASGKGTVFAVATGSHALSAIASFDGTNGDTSYAGLVADASGNLYGTTYGGGASNQGTVFKVDAVTHSLTSLVMFNGINGASPHASLIADSHGNFYGTTTSGGANGQGTVFEIANDANHTFITLAAFNGVNGAFPYAGLLADANGNLYGTTQGGGVTD